MTREGNAMNEATREGFLVLAGAGAGGTPGERAT
jgi:hypothetical protein